MIRNLMGIVMLGVIFGNIGINLAREDALRPDVVYAQEPDPPRVVLIEAKIDWTEERIKKEIRDTFPEKPELMVEVARCESRFNKNAYNPTNNSHDGGIFQLSQKYHGEKMKTLGLDPYDIADNIHFARILYKESGLLPWSASRNCWKHMLY